MLKKTGHDTRHHFKSEGYLYTLKKLVWEFIYIILKPSFTIIGLSNHRHLDFLQGLKNKKVVLLRNEGDYYCSPEIKEAVKKYRNVRYLELSGGHDDFMTNPKPYVDLLLKEL